MSDTPKCFGAVFYFFDDPAVHRQALRSAMLLWKDCWKKPFTRMSLSGDSFRAFPKTASLGQVLDRLYDPHDFQRSLFFTFFDGEPKGAMESQVLFWGCKIDNRFKSKTPNYIYVQTPAGTDIELCWRLFKETAALFPVHLALGNVMVSCNPEGQPRSGSAACKVLRQSSHLIHDFETSFRNNSYLMLLEKRDGTFLMHPSQFVSIGAELSSLCRPALQAAHAAEGELICEAAGESQVIRILSTAGVETFAKIFAPHYGDVSRPAMFWKDAEWRTWLARMQSAQPGTLFDVAAADDSRHAKGGTR